MSDTDAEVQTSPAEVRFPDGTIRYAKYIDADGGYLVPALHDTIDAAMAADPAGYETDLAGVAQVTIWVASRGQWWNGVATARSLTLGVAPFMPTDAAEAPWPPPAPVEPETEAPAEPAESPA